MSKKKYCTVRQIGESEEYPFTKGQMNWIMLHKYENGFSKIIRKIGKKHYVKMDLFDNWIESHKLKEKE